MILRKMSIGDILITYSISLVLFTMFLFSILGYKIFNESTDRLKKSLMEHAIADAKDKAAYAVLAVSIEDIDTLKEMMQELIKDEDNLFGVVADSKKNILAKAGSEEYIEYFDEASKATEIKVFSNKNYFAAVTPLLLDESKIGFLMVATRLDKIAELRKSLIIFSILIIFGIVVLGIYCYNKPLELDI